MAADVVTLKPANTVEGRPVKIMENGRTVMINNATATKADILCDNGVIHVIDTVILPKM